MSYPTIKANFRTKMYYQQKQEMTIPMYVSEIITKKKRAYKFVNYCEIL